MDFGYIITPESYCMVVPRPEDELVRLHSAFYAIREYTYIVFKIMTIIIRLCYNSKCLYF